MKLELKPSLKAIESLGKAEKRMIIGKYPICPGDHISWSKRQQYISVYSKLGPEAKEIFSMPDVCDHTGLKKYEIICQKCKERIGTVWAKNKKMEDWCSFRYESWYDKESWHGCRTPNINPYTSMLLIECCCGSDTRDFSMARSSKDKEKEKENSVGRDYGNKDSKFVLKEV